MSAFYRDIDVKISNYKSELSKPLVIFERDRGLEIYFNLVEYAYRLDKNPKNLLENLVGTLLSKVMRPVFNLPGRSAIDCIASWLGDGTIGVLLTRKQ